MWKWSFLCLTFTISVSLMAQGFDKAKMDSLFARMEANDRGMNSVSVFHNGEEVYQHAIGYADVANGIAATAQTRYRIGSITKPFTATLILQLVEAGQLSLDTRLAEFFPEVTNAEAITIEHLLRHRSGIFNFTNADDYTSWMEDPIGKEELLRKIASYESVFEPGSQAQYSNSNFVLLGLIAERVADAPYAELLQDRLCAPCGLTNTYYGAKIDPANDEAFSYKWESGWQATTETDMSVPGGAGALVSTPTDLNAFLHCLFSGNILKEPTLEAMTTFQDGFGLGLLRAPFYERTAFGHNGGIDGFVSSAFYFPEEKVSVSLLCNGQVMPINDILIGVLSIYFGRDYELPNFEPAAEVSAEQLDAYLGVYSSAGFPLKITIRRKGESLFGQATGQPEFPLEATSARTFRFLQAGLTIEFVPEEDQLILKQMGQTFTLEKE